MFSGYILKDLYVGFGSVFFDNAIFILPINFLGFDIEFIPLIFKLIPTIFTMVGFLLSFLFYSTKINYFISKKIIRIYIFLNTKWFFDFIYNNYIGYSFLNIGYNNCYKLIDKGFLEFFGATGVVTLLHKLVRPSISVQTGLIYNYISIIFLSIFVIIIYFDYYY